MHARTRNGLVHIKKILTFTERVDQDGGTAAIITMRAEPHQVIQQTRDFREHHTDVLRTHRHLNAEQLLDGQAIRVLIAHHGHIVQTVHVWQRLDERLMLSQLLSRAVQQADVRISTLNNLTIQFQNQAQHTVRRRVLGSKIQGIIFDFSHDGSHERKAAQCRPPYLSSRMMRGVISRGSMDTGS